VILIIASQRRGQTAEVATSLLKSRSTSQLLIGMLLLLPLALALALLLLLNHPFRARFVEVGG